jgi:hypothetical protein
METVMMMMQTDMMLLLSACYDPLKLKRKWIPPNNETQNSNNNHQKSFRNGLVG